MKEIIVSISIAILLVLLAIIFSGSSFSNGVNIDNATKDNNANNVSIVDGKQIIQINARGGYQPRKSTAKANMPTVIRFNTLNTFDCSSSVRIPGMNIFKMLPQNGSTDIDIGIQKSGKLNGSCGMGMYQFEIQFLD